MDTINNRVMFIIKELGYNKNSFSKEIGLLSNAVIENIVGRRMSKPSFDILSKIIHKFPEINADWLITGSGEPFKVDLKKVNIVELRKNFSSQDRNTFIWDTDKELLIKNLKQQYEDIEARMKALEKQLEDKDKVIVTMQKLIDMLEKPKS